MISLFVITYKHDVINSQIQLPGFSQLNSATVLFVKLPYIGTAQYMALQNEGGIAHSLKLTVITIPSFCSEKILTLVCEAFSDNSFCLDMCGFFQVYTVSFYDLSEIGITRYVISYHPYSFPVRLSCHFFIKAFWYWDNESLFFFFLITASD